MGNKIFRCCRCGKIMESNDYDNGGGGWFMVKDDLWKKVAKKDSNKVICKDCFEEALGRELKEEDLTSCPMNYPIVIGWVSEGKITKKEAREIIDRMFNEKITTSKFPSIARAFYREALSWLEEI